jgi:TPR repeat protein
VVIAARLWVAVADGDQKAAIELARMYAEGDGVAQNCDQARILLNAAATKGNPQAKLTLQKIDLQGDCSGI